MEKRRVIDLLDDLDNKQLLNKCVTNGIIPLKVYAYRDIFRKYEFEYSQLKIKSVSQAVCNVCEDIGISEWQVYAALRQMRKAV